MGVCGSVAVLAGGGAAAVGQQAPSGNPLTPEQTARFVERLMASDKNGDGVLTSDEVAGTPMERVFERVDGDGDGSLDRREIEQFAASRPGPRPGEPASDAPRPARPEGVTPAAEAPRVRPAGEGGDRPEDRLLFRDHLVRAGEAVKALGAADLSEANLDANLEQVAALQHSLLAAKVRTRTAPLTDEGRAELGPKPQIELKRRLLKMLRTSLDLEESLLMGDASAAKGHLGSVAEARNAMQRFIADGPGPSEDRPARDPAQRDPAQRGGGREGGGGGSSGGGGK